MLAVGLITIGVIYGALAFNRKIHDMLENNLADKLSRPQGTQMEQVDNKCEGDIFTIGDMKLRAPRAEQFRRFEVPRENPAK